MTNVCGNVNVVTNPTSFLRKDAIMKYSMKRQFAFIFITLITGTILMCLILSLIHI